MGDVHEIEIQPESCDAMGSNKVFDVKIFESWKTSKGDKLKLNDKTKHGEYICTDMKDIKLPYTHGHDYWYGHHHHHGHGHYKRKRREGEEEDSDDEEESERGYGHSHGHGHGHGHGHPTHVHDHHPDHVDGQEKRCTLSCPAGEVPASGKYTAVCQVVNGVHMWVERITNCVNADDMLAVLTAPAKQKPAPMKPGSDFYPGQPKPGKESSPDKGAGNCTSKKCLKQKKKADKAKKKANKKDKKANKQKGGGSKKAMKKQKKKERAEALAQQFGL